LSFSQQRLWLLQQADPSSAYYNMARVLRLEGILDIGALERALTEIVHRHAVLRTTIENSPEGPVQAVQPAREVALEVEPCDEEECRERILALSRRAFQLDSEWPFRCGLYRVQDDIHHLALVFHHVAVDAWTLRLLLGELGRLYSSFVKGKPWEEPAPVLDYLDFAAWHRELAASDTVEPQYEFWQKYLHNVPEMLALPLDRLRPMRPSHAGDSEGVLVSASTLASLRQLAKSKRTTLFAVLLSALEVLLSRYSQQQDFVIGTPVAGRTRPELEAIAGCLANTLFIRSTLEGDPAFGTLVERVTSAVNDAVSHQDVPFELVMERLQREPGHHSPRLQVLFALQHPAEYFVDLAGLRCEVERPSRRTSRCDLTIFAADRGSDLELEAEYDSELFEGATIRRLLGHCRALLESAVSNPEAPVSLITMVPPEDLGLLRRFNETSQAYPLEPVHVLFERQVEAAPNAVALVDGEQRITYGQLDAAANRVANYLRSRDVSPGELVAVSLPRGFPLVATLLGIWKAGAAWAPLDPDDPRLRVKKLLKDCGAMASAACECGVSTGISNDPGFTRRAGKFRLLLVEKSAASWNAPVPMVVVEDALAHPDESRLPRCGVADDLASVIYTSGSTGEPKGVEIPHRAIVRLVTNTNNARFGSQETFLAAAPITFDAATFELWGALLNGSKCVLYPGRVPEARELGRLIQQEGITTLWLTSSLFSAIVDEDPQCLKGIRQLLVGGEALSVTHVRRAMAALPDSQIINGYGPTENTTFTCCWPISGTLPERMPSVPIGSPISNTRVYVLDARREPTGIDIPGEIYIGGDGLALGYRNSPQLTEDRFVYAPWGERIYRSGDLGRWRENGTIEFLGRSDAQLKIRGFRIEPAEIEAALTEHPDVENAFAVAEEDRNGERRLAAYIQPRREAHLTEDGLRAHLLERLPLFLMPSRFYLVASIPRNANGKRDPAALPQAQTAPEEVRAPAGETELQLTEIVGRLLPDVQFGSDTNLFNVGMHSLLASRLSGEIRRKFGCSLELATIYGDATIGGIASAISAVSGATVFQGMRAAAQTPFFFVHPWEALRKLTERLADRPFLGIGFSADGPAPRTIEEHARNEVAAILRIQPKGPYFMGAWSASGVLAVEIARQLTELGYKVGLVVLFDAPNYSYFRHSPLAVRTARWLNSRCRAVGYHLKALLGQSPANWRAYLGHRAQSMQWAARQAIAEARYRRNDAGLSQMEVDQLFVAAARHHVPAPYNGRVLLLRRRERAKEWGESWDLGWKGVIQGHLEIQTIGGNHVSIFEEPHVEALAEVLRDRLDEAARST